MKILTIAIPVYNTEKYIRRCVDSLLVNEIQNDIEVILVNDGSKDNSIKILNKYKEKYPETNILEFQIVMTGLIQKTSQNLLRNYMKKMQMLQ